MAKLSVTINNISYRTLIMDAKDFDILCGLLDRTTVVDNKYLETADGGYETHAVVTQPATLEATTKIGKLISEEEYQQRKDAIAKAKDMAEQTAEAI